MDRIPAPNVVTTVKSGQLLIKIFAYRPSSEKECRIAIRTYMSNSKLERLPSSGTIKIFTLFGNNPLDNL